MANPPHLSVPACPPSWEQTTGVIEVDC
ncbi:rCG32045 [Rattus norvegicus]|uniref:RCG32045 n=1 Tax=Rattus norvegicus TaxID=10116 RepID=A6KS57_RAT|nr:rCG32045 [Rattus norvegicus]